MLPVLDMRRLYPCDIDGDFVEPDTRHPIDDDSGDLLLVTYTDIGWIASRHISNPVGGESDEMYWTPVNAKTGPVVALLRCGPAQMSETEDAYLDLSDLVEDALFPVAVRQRRPLNLSLRIGSRPVEADYRPSTRDRTHFRTDGYWEDVNGSSGSSMRPTGATFVLHRRVIDGIISHVRVTVNSTYDGGALEKCLRAIDE